jgi:anaerobic magnesium-protoporphyrin IX monomethyl ester cyclase
MLHQSYGVNVFLLVDEYPTNERDRWEEFLDRLLHLKLPIYLLMETRVEDIVRDRDILWKYRAAGIVHIYVGVESTNQDTLDVVKKEINVEQSQEAIRLIREYRMISETSFVLGFPWETKESIEQTLELAQQYNPDFAHFLAITPWPYADMYSDMKEYIEVYDYSKYNLVEPIIRPTAMSLEDIRRAIVGCYRQYYMRKAPLYFSDNDLFRRTYLIRSMHLIMKNSFLTKMMKEFGETTMMKMFHSRPDEALVGKD